MAAVFTHNGNGHLRISGEIDIANAGQFATLLATVEDEIITLDCEELTFLDSAGIHALVGQVKEARTVRLINVPDNVATVLRIVGLAETFGLPAQNGYGSC